MSKVFAISPRLNQVLLFFILSRIYIIFASKVHIGNSQIYLQEHQLSSISSLLTSFLSSYFYFVDFSLAFSSLMAVIDCTTLCLLYRYAKNDLKFSGQDLSYLILFYSAIGLAFLYIFYHRLEIISGFFLVCGLCWVKNRLLLLYIIAIILILSSSGSISGNFNLESLPGNILLIFDKIGHFGYQIGYYDGRFQIGSNLLIGIVLAVVFCCVASFLFFWMTKKNFSSALSDNQLINLLLLFTLFYFMTNPNLSSITLMAVSPILAIKIAKSYSPNLILLITILYFSNFIASQFDYFGLASKSSFAILALSIKHLSLAGIIFMISKEYLKNDKAKN